MDFYSAVLTAPDLEGPDPEEADLLTANLYESNLQGANLRRTKGVPHQLAEAESPLATTLPDDTNLHEQRWDAFEEWQAKQQQQPGDDQGALELHGPGGRVSLVQQIVERLTVLQTWLAGLEDTGHQANGDSTCRCTSSAGPTLESAPPVFSGVHRADRRAGPLDGGSQSLCVTKRYATPFTPT